MSKTLQQIYIANPITTNASTDLMYFSQSPYTAGKDAGMTYANFANQLGSSTPTANIYVKYDSNKNLSANNFLSSYNTTVTSAGTTVLTVSSAQLQYFTGSTTHTLTLPVVSTLVLGFSFTIVNNSTGVVTVQSSGGNTIENMQPQTQLVVTCIATTGTSNTSWDTDYTADILPVPLADGGTNASLSAISGGIAYSGASAIAITSAGVPGQVLVSNGASPPTWQNTDGGFSTVSVSGTTQLAIGNVAYILNNAAATTVTLPSSGSSTIGDTIKIKGRSAAPWIIQANTSQIITYESTSSSSAGTATSSQGTDSIQLTYVASNEWSIDWAASSLITLA